MVAPPKIDATQKVNSSKFFHDSPGNQSDTSWINDEASNFIANNIFDILKEQSQDESSSIEDNQNKKGKKGKKGKKRKTNEKGKNKNESNFVRLINYMSKHDFDEFRVGKFTKV